MTTDDANIIAFRKDLSAPAETLVEEFLVEGAASVEAEETQEQSFARFDRVRDDARQRGMSDSDIAAAIREWSNRVRDELRQAQLVTQIMAAHTAAFERGQPGTFRTSLHQILDRARRSGLSSRNINAACRKAIAMFVETDFFGQGAEIRHLLRELGHARISRPNRCAKMSSTRTES